MLVPVIGVYAGYHAIYGDEVPRIATSMDGIFTPEARARREGGSPADAPE